MRVCETRAQIRGYNVQFVCDTRAQIRDGTTLGLAAKSYIDKGDLVPDKVIVSILKLVGFGLACAPVRCAHPSF